MDKKASEEAEALAARMCLRYSGKAESLVKSWMGSTTQEPTREKTEEQLAKEDQELFVPALDR
jgi:hypothetical protein